MKILVTGRLPEDVMARIEQGHQVEKNEQDRPMDRQRLLNSIGDKEGLLCMITDRIDEGCLDRAPNLMMIANFAVGYDNIDIQAATKRGIWVSNTPEVLTEATADITFALILATARRVVEGDRRVREGRFRFWAPLLFLGREVSGKMLGIIGMGRIGKAVARRAQGFQMPIVYHNRKRIDAAEENRLGVEYLDLKSLLSKSDFISLHVPMTNDTCHMIGSKELEMMRPDAYLINTSRGPVVDEKALLEALKGKRIAGAGLDVYENEPALTPGLADLDNITLLPHVGSATQETRAKMARLAAKNLLAGLRGERPPNCLNCDAIPLSRDRANPRNGTE